MEGILQLEKRMQWLDKPGQFIQCKYRQSKQILHKWRWTWAAVPVVGLLAVGTILIVIFSVVNVEDDVEAGLISFGNESGKFLRRADEEYRVRFLKLKSPKQSNFTEAVRLCSETGGEVVINPLEYQMKEYFEKVVNSTNCSVVYTGLRFTDNDWIARDRSYRIYGGSVNSLWNRKIYEDNTNIAEKKFCSAAMNFGSQTPHLIPYSCDRMKTHCFVCQTRSPNCKGNICYEPFAKAMTINNGEIECNKRSSTLAVPHTFEMLDNVIQKIREVKGYQKCKVISMGFMYETHLEDILHRRLNFTLSPFDEKGKMSHTCVGIKVKDKKYSRIDCSNADCTLCLVPKQLLTKKIWTRENEYTEEEES